MARRRGLSFRLKLMLSYAGFLLLAGVLLLGVVWIFLLRYVPTDTTATVGGFVPNRSDLLRAFVPSAVVVVLFLLAFGIVGGWLLAGRMLSPLAQITEVARAVTAGSLAQRIELRGRNDEFRELADAFDTMLTRVEAQLAEEQRFAANASHELRTPLAITQTLLEVASADPQRNTDELLGRLRAVNSRAIELVEALLILSRADRRSFTREPVDVSLLAEEATETLVPFADERGVTIEVGGDSGLTVGSSTLLLQLVTNLVHNAIVHNLSSAGVVWVSTATHSDFVTVIIENTGEEISAEMISTLTEPFQRGDGRIQNHHAGVGLGLAIARSITEAHDGSLTLTPRPDGGLRVVVQLPIVADGVSR